MNRATWALLALLVLGGCGPATLPAPTIVSVEPLQIAEGVPAVISVQVDAVLPVSVDYQKQAADPDHHKMTLQLAGQTAEIAFAESDGTLVAPVPEALPQGFYDVRVTLADGRQAVREQAFAIVPAPTLMDGEPDPVTRGGLTGFQIEHIRDQVRGVPFEITVRAMGPGANTYQGKLFVRSNKGGITRLTQGTFVRGMRMERLVLEHSGGHVRLMIADALGNLGLSNSFRVRPK